MTTINRSAASAGRFDEAVDPRASKEFCPWPEPPKPAIRD